MNGALLPLHKPREQAVFEQLVDVFQEGCMSGFDRMVSNGHVTKCEKRRLVLTPETRQAIKRPLFKPGAWLICSTNDS